MVMDLCWGSQNLVWQHFVYCCQCLFYTKTNFQKLFFYIGHRHFTDDFLTILWYPVEVSNSCQILQPVYIMAVLAIWSGLPKVMSE